MRGSRGSGCQTVTRSSDRRAWWWSWSLGLPQVLARRRRLSRGIRGRKVVGHTRSSPPPSAPYNRRQSPTTGPMKSRRPILDRFSPGAAVGFWWRLLLGDLHLPIIARGRLGVEKRRRGNRAGCCRAVRTAGVTTPSTRPADRRTEPPSKDEEYMASSYCGQLTD